MSRFRIWVNHVTRPCAFVVKLQADFDIEPISGLAFLYPGSGAALSWPIYFGGKSVVSGLLKGMDGKL